MDQAPALWDTPGERGAEHTTLRSRRPHDSTSELRRGRRGARMERSKPGLNRAPKARPRQSRGSLSAKGKTLGVRSGKRRAWERAREQGTPGNITRNLGEVAGRRSGKPGNQDRITRNLGNTEEPGRNSGSLLKGSWRWEARKLGKRLRSLE